MQSKPTAAACDRLHGVLTLCMEITNTTKADCFFRYSAHINCYSVVIYRDGWAVGSDNEEWVANLLDITEENVKATLDKLAAIYCELEGLKNV